MSDRTHIYHMYVFKTGEGQILQYFAPKTAGAADITVKKVFGLFSTVDGTYMTLRRHISRLREDARL